MLVRGELFAGLMETHGNIGVFAAHLGVQGKMDNMTIGHGPGLTTGDAKLATIFLNVFFVRHCRILLCHSIRI